MRRGELFFLLVGMVLLGFASVAMADSISPITFTGSGPTGASYTVHKTVTIDTISNALYEYSTVSIDTSEAPFEVEVKVVPNAYVGAFDRSITRNFGFEVTFTDLEPGTHTFNIYATVDGDRVATESDSITSSGVSKTSTIPSLTEWGMLILTIMVGMASIYSLRRQRIM